MTALKNAEISVDQEEHVGDAQAARSGWRDIFQHRRIFGWCLLIFLLPINFGYENSISGSILAMPQFLERFGHQANGTLVISAKHQQILNAALSIGVFCAAIITGFLSDAYGRRKAIIVASAICCAGVLVQYYSKSILMLFSGKVVATLGFGIGHSVAPVFISEIAPSSIRGICLALINTMIVCGQWLASLTVFGATFKPAADAWRIPLICQLIPPGISFLAAMTILPESPAWFLMKDHRQKAEKSFRRFNGSQIDAERSLNQTLTAIIVEREHANSNRSWVECFQQPNLRRTTIVVMTYSAQQVIGVNFIAGYLTYYFSLAGVNDPLAIAQASYAIQVFGNMCSWLMIERLGRRRLIVGGCIAMTTTLPIIGGISILNTPAALKATVALMTIWGFLYQATLGACAYAIGGEVPTPALRQKTYAINMITTTLSSTLVYQLIPILINSDKANLGGKIAFVFFGPSVPMCVYLFYCLPETTGRSFDELEEMFQARIPARKFRGYVTELRPAVVQKSNQDCTAIVA
ncbi:general substrate transporter [Aspergillus spinulosporus]